MPVEGIINTFQRLSYQRTHSQVAGLALPASETFAHFMNNIGPPSARNWSISDSLLLEFDRHPEEGQELQAKGATRNFDPWVAQVQSNNVAKTRRQSLHASIGDAVGGINS